MARTVQKAFGEALREQRNAIGLSQEGLALRAAVDRTFVSQIERGVRQPTITTLWKLAEALQVSPSRLIATTEQLAGHSLSPTRG